MKNNQNILIIAGLILAIILFANFSSLSIVNFGSRFWEKQGNSIILSVSESERFDSTTGFQADGLNGGGRNFLTQFTERGLTLETFCTIDSGLSSTRGIVPDLMFQVNGVATLSSDNLVCTIPPESKTQMENELVENCDSEWVSEHGEDRCKTWTLYNSATKITWIFSELVRECEEFDETCGTETEKNVAGLFLYECNPETFEFELKGKELNKCGVECITDSDCEGSCSENKCVEGGISKNPIFIIIGGLIILVVGFFIIRSCKK